MTKPAAFYGSYVDAKFMRGLKVTRVMIDIPIESTNAFLAAFGAPDGVNPVPVAIARLVEGTYHEPGPVAQRDRAAVDTDASVSGQHVGGSSPPGSTKREYTRSQMAAIKCQDQFFIDWLEKHYATTWNTSCLDDLVMSAPAVADNTLKRICGISSKKELDVPGAAQAAFDKLLASYDYRDRVK